MGLMSELLYLQECLDGSLGELEQVAREETAYDDDENHHHSEEGCRSGQVDSEQLLVRLKEESGFHHMDVVVEGDDHIDHSNEHQQEVSSLHRRGEDQELSSESYRRRDAS